VQSGEVKSSFFLEEYLACCLSLREKTTFCLSASFRADLEWWHAFVKEWNGVAMFGVEGQERGPR